MTDRQHAEKALTFVRGAIEEGAALDREGVGRAFGTVPGG